MKTRAETWKERFKEQYSWQDEIDIKIVFEILAEMHDLERKLDPKEPCKHLHSEVRASDLLGHAFCHDCGSDVMIFAVFNNWIQEFKKLQAELK